MVSRNAWLATGLGAFALAGLAFPFFLRVNTAPIIDSSKPLPQRAIVMAASISDSTSDAVVANICSTAPSKEGTEEGFSRDKSGAIVGTSICCRSTDSDGAAMSHDEDRAANNSSAICEPDPLPPHNGVVNSKEVDMVLRFHHCFLVFDDTTYLNLTSVKDGKFKLWRSHISEIRENWLDRYYKYRPSALNPRGKDEKAKRRKVTTVYAGFVKLIVAEFILGWNVDYTYETAGNGRLLPIHPDVERIYRSRLIAEKALAGDRQVSNKVVKRRKALVLGGEEEHGRRLEKLREATKRQNVSGAHNDLSTPVLPEPCFDKMDAGGSKGVHAEATMLSGRLDGVGLVEAPALVSSIPPATSLGVRMDGRSFVGAQCKEGTSAIDEVHGSNGDSHLHREPSGSPLRDVMESLGQSQHGLQSGNVSCDIEALLEGGREKKNMGNTAVSSIVSEVLKQKNGPPVEVGCLEPLVADLRLRLEEQEKRIQSLERRMPCVEVIALEGLVEILKTQLAERDRRISFLEAKAGTKERMEMLPKSNTIERLDGDLHS